MKTNILRTGTVVCASVLMMSALPSLADQAAAAAKPDKTYTGTVAAVNATDRTLEVKGLMFHKAFNLGDACTYALLNKPTGTIGDLQPGQKVMVSYQDAHGVLVADRIKQEPMTCIGMVTAMDTTKHTVTIGKYRKFDLPDNCAVVLRGGKSGSPADVEIGDRVTVTFETPDNTLTAREIAQTSATFIGAVTAIDTTDGTVKARSVFDSKTFHIGDGCAIMVNGKPAGQLGDLQLGQRLEFNYDAVDGVNIANRIGQAPFAPQPETTATQPMMP